MPFAQGEFHWRLTPSAISETTTSIDIAGPTFLLAGGTSSVLVSEAGEAAWRLADGEAVFRAGGSPVDVVALAPGAASLTAITLEPGSDSSAFTAGESVRDVDLIRGQLVAGESFTVHSDVAAFVLVTEGLVDAGGTAVSAGATALLGGEFVVTNASAEPATLVVVVIGPAVDGASVAAPGTESAPAPRPAARPRSEHPAGAVRNDDDDRSDGGGRRRGRAQRGRRRVASHGSE